MDNPIIQYMDEMSDKDTEVIDELLEYDSVVCECPQCTYGEEWEPDEDEE